MSEKMTRTEMKEAAQTALMHGIGNVLGYWLEENGYQVPEGQHEEFQTIMVREADRVAKILGYEKAWSN